MIARPALASLAALLAIGCASTPENGADEEPQLVCTLEARSSLAVTVLDDATGANLAPNAEVRATDGTVSETLNPDPTTGVYSGGLFERAGTFTVVVSHPNYQQWQRAGIVVGRDECHVLTEAVTARLTRR